MKPDVITETDRICVNAPLATRKSRTNALPVPPIPLWKLALVTVGPGLVAMLADTDAGSVMVAAQSGAQWSYRLRKRVPPCADTPGEIVGRPLRLAFEENPAGAAPTGRSSAAARHPCPIN
jgi:hypothetical protein